MNWEYDSQIVETKRSTSRGVIDSTTLNHLLTDYGQQGWELVSVVAISDGNVGTAKLLLVFKRPVMESQH